MSLESRIEKRLSELEALLLARVNHLERELHRLEDFTVATVERLNATDQLITAALVRVEHEINRIERKNRRQDREIEELEEQLKPHHYPATTGMTFKPA